MNSYADPWQRGRTLAATGIATACIARITYPQIATKPTLDRNVRFYADLSLDNSGIQPFSAICAGLFDPLAICVA